MRSRVCVLTGGTWWPLAPTDTHTGAKCSAQQSKGDGKHTPHTRPPSTTKKSCRVERRVTQLARVSARLMIDSFPLLRMKYDLSACLCRHHLVKSEFKTSLMAPQQPEMSIKALDFSHGVTLREMRCQFSPNFPRQVPENRNRMILKRNLRKREFLQLQVCNKCQRKSLSQRARSVCYGNTGIGEGERE